MRVAIYARVSTIDKGQDPELQIKPLRAYCEARGWALSDEYIDKGISGSKDKRPELSRLLDAARKRQIDVILVWKLDRFGRSLKHLVTTLEELNGLGISFISYSENIDLSSATGRLMFHIIASMAEFERELIKERVKAGIQNARAKGKRHGRRPLPPVTVRKVIEVYELKPELSVREIAREVNISPASADRIKRDYKNGLFDRDGFRYEKALVS